MVKCMDYPKRKSPRIPGYDYSNENYYFITICTHDKQCIFGSVNKQNNFGRIAKNHIIQLSNHYDGVYVDHYVVMPNHVHMIIVLENSGKNDLNQVIGQFKSGVSREIRNMEPAMRVWQRSYYDHVIRNEKSYCEIWEYIEYNPLKWEEDRFYSKDQKM